jgi:hypothetical protein
MDGQWENGNGHKAASGDQRQVNTTFENANGKVDWQIGVLNGDVHNYEVNPTASAAERFEKGLKLLQGNMARRAEELIRGAAEDDYRSNRVAYYWALSVLSGRQIGQVHDEEYERLQHCFTMADQGPPDEWLAALAVVRKFLNCCLQYQRGKIREDDYGELIQAYDDLSQDHREELRRHLDLIMTGALQGQLDAKYAVEIEQIRVSGDRAGRAWKFFEATPAEPQPEVLIEPRLGVIRRLAAGFGVLLAAAGLALALVASTQHSALADLVFIAGTGGGGYLLARTGKRWLVAREQVAADDDRHGGFSEPWKTSVEMRREGIRESAAATNARKRRQHRKPLASRRYRLSRPDDTDRDDDYEWGEDDDKDREHRNLLAKRRLFRFLAAGSVNSRFSREKPPNSANKREKWWQDTKGLREALASDLKRRYATSDIALNQLDWLMTWHARQSKERWDHGALREDRERLRRATPHGTLILLWVVVAGAGLVSGLIGAFDAGAAQGLLVMLALGVGGGIVHVTRLDVYLVGRALYRAESNLAARRHQGERDEWTRWKEILKDRPADAEIARWLDYDKVYIKNEVMKELGLVNRDIMAHAVLTEGQLLSVKAREVFGPPRYSEYQVTVILLTDRGVAKISKNLDFRNGELTPGDREKVFSYDSICSADIVRVEVQFAGDHRKVVELDDGDDSERPVNARTQASPPKPQNSQGASQPSVGSGPDVGPDAAQRDKNVDQVVFGQSLRLSLNSGTPVDFVVENFDEAFLDERRGESAEKLFDITMDISGMRMAQRMLRAIAMSTREWIAIERQRQEERLLDFQDATGASPVSRQERTTGEPDRQTAAMLLHDGVSPAAW